MAKTPRHKPLWLATPADHDFPAAVSYLELLLPKKNVSTLVADSREAKITRDKAKDIFRASRLSLLGISNSHVERDRQKIKQGVPLSPILLVRAALQDVVIVADTLRTLQDDIQAEHMLIASRVTWYVTSLAFLLTAYATSWNPGFTWPDFFHRAIPIAAVVLSAVIFASIYVATWAQDVDLRYGPHTRAATNAWHACPKASAISSPPCLLRLLPAGAVAGWDSHPLESAALSRHTRCGPSRPSIQRVAAGGSAFAAQQDARKAGDELLQLATCGFTLSSNGQASRHQVAGAGVSRFPL